MANATAAVTAAVAASVATSVATSVAASVATSTAASVTASTATSTAASAGASSVSSASSVKPGAAVATLLGSQRFVMYGGAAGGGTSIEAKSCTMYEPNVLMGRLGAFSALQGFMSPPLSPSPPLAPNSPVAAACAAAASSRRRLRIRGSDDLAVAGDNESTMQPSQWGRRLQGKKRSKGSGSPENAAVSTYLLAVLGDAVTTYLTVLCVVYLFHVLLINLYRYVLNRKFYRALAEEEATGVPCEELPKFRALPPSLVYPRFELTIATIFATGLMEAAANVLGTAVAEYELAIGLIGAAVVIVSLVFLSLAQQAMHVHAFARRRAKSVWQASESIESYDEMDDPILRLVYRSMCCLPRCLRLQPVKRMKGEWSPPDGAVEEPGRTERALKRAEWFGIKCSLSSLVCCFVKRTASSKATRGQTQNSSGATTTPIDSVHSGAHNVVFDIDASMHVVSLNEPNAPWMIHGREETGNDLASDETVQEAAALYEEVRMLACDEDAIIRKRP